MRKVLVRTMSAVLIAGYAAVAAAQGDPSQVISQAEQDLALAKEKESVWMVIDQATGSAAVNLPKLLDAAKKAQQDGDAAEAQRLAEKVSTFAKLGTAQAEGQSNASPVYPQ